MRSRLLIGLLVTGLLAAWAAPVLADAPATIPPGGTRFREGHPQNSFQRGHDHDRRHDGGRHGRPHNRPHFGGGHGHKVVVPGPVFVVPRSCWTPGYWAYQWVPHAAAYQVWVPGHWSPAGTWVPGHYQTQYQGYYQPYWVEGFWVGC